MSIIYDQTSEEGLLVHLSIIIVLQLIISFKTTELWS